MTFGTMRIFDSIINEEVEIYDSTSFPYTKYIGGSVVSKGSRLSYYDYVCAFDIETTTIQAERPYGFMYLWGFCIEEDVCMGRTWNEYIDFIQKLVDHIGTDANTRLVVYVQFLNFEFQFMRRFFIWENVFATDVREVVKASTPNVEYRCSYRLTNKSLRKFNESSPSCIHLKQDGEEYDYSIKRTPSTKLKEKEYFYQYCDVKGLVESLKDLLKKDTLATIPITSTGYVRRDCRLAMRKNPKNRKDFYNMRLTKELYLMVRDATRGGNTHASRQHVGVTLEDIFNYDIASSYPYVMMCEYFPMSPFTKMKVKNKKQFKRLLEVKCVIFEITFLEICLKEDISVPYISFSKCRNRLDVIQFNGRVLEAKSVTMTLTEIDYEIIRKQYHIRKFHLENVYIAERGNLPQELKNVINEYFYKKCTLKEVDDYAYAKSKELLNAIFGMMLTNIVYQNILYNGEWDKDNICIDKELEKFYKGKNNFLSYQWGIYVTAHARKNLQVLIDIAGDDLIYTDTDSVKSARNLDIEVEKINKEIKLKAEVNKAYADYDGKRFYMGIWEKEKNYERMKTLGAKKYAYEQDGELHITIAGVNKKEGAKELKTLDNFQLLFQFKKAGGTTSWYNDDDIHWIEIDGEKILTASNIGILPSTYTLGITGEFFENMGLYLTNESDWLTEPGNFDKIKMDLIKLKELRRKKK